MGDNRRSRRETCPSATVSGTNLSQCQCGRHKPVPVPLCPAHISHDTGSNPGLPCDRPGPWHSPPSPCRFCPLLTRLGSGNGPHGEKSTQHSSIYCGQNAEDVVHLVGLAGNRSKFRRYAVVVFINSVYTFRRAVLTDCNDVVQVDSRVEVRMCVLNSCICVVPGFALHIRCLKPCRALH